MGNTCSTESSPDKLNSSLLSNEIATTMPESKSGNTHNIKEPNVSNSPTQTINTTNSVLFTQPEMSQQPKVAHSSQLSLESRVAIDSSRFNTSESPPSFVRHDVFSNNDSYTGAYIYAKSESGAKSQIPVKHGRGVYTYADGSSFRGTYRYDQMHHGVFTHVFESHTVVEHVSASFQSDKLLPGESSAKSNAPGSDENTRAEDPHISMHVDNQGILDGLLSRQISLVSVLGDITQEVVTAPGIVHLSKSQTGNFIKTKVSIQSMSIYEGDFEGGKYHGNGKIIYVGSRSVSTKSTESQLERSGKPVPNSSVQVSEVEHVDVRKKRLEVMYEGQWRNGRRQGFGKAILIDGRTIEGYWYGDRLLACVNHKYHFSTLSDDKLDNAGSNTNRRNMYRRAIHPSEVGSIKPTGVTLVEEQAREISPDGTVYLGAFNADFKRHTARHPSLQSTDLELHFDPKGSSCITFTNGDVLFAHFRDGVVFGRGVMQYKTSGNVYNGHFISYEESKPKAFVSGSNEDYDLVKQMRNCEMTVPAISLDGGVTILTKLDVQPVPFCVINIKRHGEGKCTYTDSGEVYVGQFVNDQKEGTGICIGRTGCTYRGEYLADQYHGTGTLRWPDGSEYSGHWRNGQKCGPYGRLAVTNGDVIECAWHNDKKNGPGKITFGNGNIFFGEFVNDLKHGQCGLFNGQTGIYELGSYSEDEMKRLIQKLKPGQYGYLNAIALDENFRKVMHEHSLDYAREEADALYNGKIKILERNTDSITTNSALTKINNGNSQHVSGNFTAVDPPAKSSGIKSAVSAVGRLMRIGKSNSKQMA